MDQNEKDLRELIESDKRSVISFLDALGLKLVGNKVAMLFSDSGIDEPNLDRLQFLELYQLQYEPSLIKVEFTIKKSKGLNSNITGTLGVLLDKIVERDFPVVPNKILDTSTHCPHFKSIKIQEQKGNLKVKMYGAICYCS